MYNIFKKMNILSIHYGHDSSACILKDGNVCLYFKEERISRKKRDNLPFSAIKRCIENFNEKITHIIITSTNYTLTYECIIKFLSCHIEMPSEKNIFNLTSQHHISHVGSAFFSSGFEESIVIVVDGRGSSYRNQLSECESVYLISYEKGLSTLMKNYFTPVYMNFDEISENTKNTLSHNSYKCGIYNEFGGIVNVYTTASLLIGQGPLDNGKTMGLSSYGENIKNFPKLFIDDYGKVDEKNFKIHCYDCDGDYHMPILKNGDYSKKVTNNVTEKNYKFYADYAYEIQTQTQEAVSNIIEYAVKKTGIKKVCISGGYGMNIVANHFYLNKFPDIDFYFDPICDDSGSSIGIAKMFWYSLTNDRKIKNLKTTSFHGVHYDISSYRGKTTPIEEIAKILYKNKSIAVYTGLSEAGQRALGNRSILFNALNTNAKKLVNKIKKREWYRPFACMVLEEDANTYFDMGKIKSSPFMTICFPVKKEFIDILSGIVHVDQTCRIQTISKNDGYLYDLLQYFKIISGHGILLNTSFNLAGDPLVETPKDAFETLYNSCLDYLWFEETQQLFKNIKDIKDSGEIKYI